MELKNIERGRIREYAEKYGVKYVPGAKPWFEKADIATPCATQNEINAEAATALINNGIIAVTEGANMPSTPEAVRIFQEAKVLYCPGKASNAGGVAVSGLEMTQNSETTEMGYVKKLTKSYITSWMTSMRIVSDMEQSLMAM